MFFETVKSEGLAHLSYLIGDGGAAAVIDPRLDCHIYPDLARQHGARITHIFETHRNEDYLVGSRALAGITGAEVFHSGKQPFTYGHDVAEGDRFDLGGVRLTVLETPGHTPEHLAFLAADRSSSDDPFAVFTGDALFVGSSGRTDLAPERKEEMAALLYDSLFGKLLALPDGVLVHPAHGRGSACGSGMSSREVSTIGYEKRHNPTLQHDTRDGFVQAKLGERLETPPYFARMREANLHGALLDRLPDPDRLPVQAFQRQCDDGMVVVDVRRPEAFGGAHVPGAWSLMQEVLGHFAGWFLPADRPLGLVVNDDAQRDAAIRDLVRVGYDRIAGCLVTMDDWAVCGLEFAAVPQISTDEVLRRLNTRAPFLLLDVRSAEEFTGGHLPGAKHIYVGHLPDRLHDVPRDLPIVTFCSTGHRASIAASILQQHGYPRVENCLGSMQACQALDCPVIREAA
ncbi:MAG: MBL fold metallo-hydrolase [Armatimonadota bacterium]